MSRSTTRRTLVLGGTAALAGVAVPSRADAATRPNGLYSSGTLGRWQGLAHDTSPSSVDRAAAADARGVRLLGDSIAHLTRPRLSSMLAEKKRVMSWDTWSGRPTAPLARAASASAAAATLPRTLVVVSGSNDIFSPAAFPRALAALLAVAGDRRVLWVSPHVARAGSPAADVRNSALISLSLERAAATHRTLTVVPWFDVLAAKPAYRIPAYTPDGVHPRSAAGIDAFVALIARYL